MGPARAAVRLLWALWCLLGCDGGRSTAGSEPSPTGRPATLTVFAASSLTEAFEALARGFEAAHPGTEVQLSFAGSQVLRVQLEQGARADLFASANEAHMRALLQAGTVSESSVFAENSLVVVVPAAGSATVSDFAELPRAQRIVLGSDNVPAGIYAGQVLARASDALGRSFASDVMAHVVSRESNVRLVRAKVALGEADAAIVYASDAAASQRLRTVAIPAAFNVRARYPIGLVAGSQRTDSARAFVDFIRSPGGQAILSRHGFLPVTP